MKTIKKTWKYAVVLSILMIWVSAITVLAEGDNSLASLGIANGEVSPEFYYATTEYDVTVAAGTKELILEPQTSDSNARISSVDGTMLEDGQGTVTISVEADNGSVAVYTLHVKADEASVTESAAETQTQAVTEVKETQQAATPETQAADSVVTQLRQQVTTLENKADLSMKILYGLIAFAVILLFIIINLILKNKDLRDDIRDAQDALDSNTNEFARKEKNLSSDYYYAPVQEMQPESANAPGAPIEKIQEDTEQVFGNAKIKVTADAVAKQENYEKQQKSSNRQKPSNKQKQAKPQNINTQKQSSGSPDHRAENNNSSNNNSGNNNNSNNNTEGNKKQSSGRQTQPNKQAQPPQRKQPRQQEQKKGQEPKKQPRQQEQEKGQEPKNKPRQQEQRKNQEPVKIDVTMIDL